MTDYRFFKFYKACDLDCDLVIDFYPATTITHSVNILVNFEHPEVPKARVLPTWQNNPAWTIGLKTSQRIIIGSTESWFKKNRFTKDGKKLPLTSKGWYIIGVQSSKDMSFVISARTLNNGQKGKQIDIEKVYLGGHAKDEVFDIGQSKYYYFQNWRDERVCFKVEFLSRFFNIEKMFVLDVGRLNDGNQDRFDGQGGRVPKTEEELARRWVPTNSTELAQDQTGSQSKTVCVDKMSNDFCVLCTYLLKVTNRVNPKSHIKSSKVKISVQQSISESPSEESFSGKLQVGYPQSLALEQNSQIDLEM